MDATLNPYGRGELDMRDVCTAIRPLLSAYGDGELPEEQQRFIQQHLRQCEECARIFEAEQSVKKLLIENFPRESAPFELKARIRRELDRAGGQKRLWSWIFPKPALAVVSAVAALLVLWVGYRSFRGRPPVEPAQIAHVKLVSGKIECVNCYLARKYHVENYCKEFGHEFVFLADDGEIYSLIPNGLSEKVRRDITYQHAEVLVSGWFYYPANAVELESVEPVRRAAAQPALYGRRASIAWRNR